MTKIIDFPKPHERVRQSLRQSIEEAFSPHEEPFKSEGIADMVRFLDMYVPGKEDIIILPSWVTQEQGDDIKAVVQPMFIELQNRIGLMLGEHLLLRTQKATCDMLHKDWD